ncbi:MAG: sterol desaturase family protein [Pseudomonadales bacterium]
MPDAIQSYLQDVTSLFSNSQQRLYWGYLLCALGVAVSYSLYLKFQKNSTSTSGLLSSLKAFVSSSALADYKIILINKAIFLSIAPLLVTKLAIATALFEALHQVFDGRIALFPSLPQWAVITLFTLFVFIFDDFMRFFCHRLMHKLSWLWLFHQTHHSATSLTPLTVLRTHPVEGVIFALRSALVQGISIALFVYFFAERVDLFTVLNVNIALFVFNVAGSNLRHSHVRLCYWPWLEKWLISPAQHQLHHSTNPKHFDSNYGAVLAIWDRCFDSLIYSKNNDVTQFGLSNRAEDRVQTLSALYVKPLFQCYRKLRRVMAPKSSKPTVEHSLD